MSLLRSLRTSIFLIRKNYLATSAYSKGNVQNEGAKSVVDPKDRSEVINVETSIRYMNSEAYKKTYGSDPVWLHYRRNHKGNRPPDTRRTCIRKGKICTGSPCPICRDKYLVVHHKNIDLLKQFISPHGGHILKSLESGVCQKQHQNLTVEINKAWNYGLMSYDVPHRKYDYRLYYKSAPEENA